MNIDEQQLPPGRPTIAQILKRALDRRGRTVAWLARKCGVSWGAAKGWFAEGDSFRTIGPSHVVLAMRALGVTRDEIAQASDYLRLPRGMVGLTDPPVDVDAVIDQAQIGLGWIYRARVGGDPQLALDMAENMAREIERAELAASVGAGEFLRSILARVLYEQAVSVAELFPRELVWRGIDPIVAHLELVAERSKDHSEADGLALSLRGNIHYVTKDYPKAIRDLTQATALLTKRPDQYLWAARALLLGRAYANDPEGFSRDEKEVIRVIEAGRLSGHLQEHIVHTKEGHGRGLAILGQEDKAFRVLDEAGVIHERATSPTVPIVPMRGVQLARSRLEILLLTQRGDKDSIEREGRLALRIAKEHRYERHGAQIEGLLKKTL